ncbi:MAG: transcription termination/antitermination protein NusG [Phycisphaerales bacterium JB043]
MTTDPHNDAHTTPSDTSPETPVEVVAPAVEQEAPSADTQPEAPAPEAEAEAPAPVREEEPHTRAGMNWFALRVASNKENYVRDTLLRKVEIEGMTHLIGRILVPTEKTKTIKAGKSRITEVKQYPGYVFVEMRLEDDGRIPQDIFFLVKETTGVGDFVGATGRPTPLANHEIVEIHNACKAPEETPTVRMTYEPGEQVNITEGPFEGYEGTVDELLPEKGKVRVLVTIFGRQAPVEIEEWMLTKATEE